MKNYDTIPLKHGCYIHVSTCLEGEMRLVLTADRTYNGFGGYRITTEEARVLRSLLAHYAELAEKKE